MNNGFFICYFFSRESSEERLVIDETVTDAEKEPSRREGSGEREEASTSKGGREPCVMKARKCGDMSWFKEYCRTHRK